MIFDKINIRITIIIPQARKTPGGEDVVEKVKMYSKEFFVGDGDEVELEMYPTLNWTAHESNT